jgi:inorganic phosphate transporter, PiT family
MATSIATGALKPRTAVAISGALNFLGAFLSLAVAATIANGLVNTADVTLTVVAAGLAGGIIWNLITWLFGIPSSSSHALIGGVIGATIAAAGGSAVLWHGLTSKVIIPAALSPVIAGLVAAVGTWSPYRITRSLTQAARGHGFRIGQIGSACLVSLAHGTNDAQKTMGVITLALIANGTLAKGSNAPVWVIVSCAIAISLGTYIGGWRVIRMLGKGLVEIAAPQGMAAESADQGASGRGPYEVWRTGGPHDPTPLAVPADSPPAGSGAGMVLALRAGPAQAAVGRPDSRPAKMTWESCRPAELSFS